MLILIPRSQLAACCGQSQCSIEPRPPPKNVNFDRTIHVLQMGKFRFTKSLTISISSKFSNIDTVFC